jgi:hypothetical protein
MPYDINEHKHRFAAWAAGRAAQRGWGGATIARLQDALVRSAIKGWAETCPETLSAEGFDKLHREWCRSICQTLLDLQCTYGRASKLVSIYLKCWVILSGNGQSSAARTIHPPIDRILLDRMGIRLANHEIPNWTELTEEGYFGIIEEIRQILAGQPLWMAEEHWDIDA